MELGYYTETGEAKLSNFISCIFFTSRTEEYLLIAVLNVSLQRSIPKETTAGEYYYYFA